MLPQAARNFFLQNIFKDGQLKRQDLALEFHEHYTKYHRPVGAHLLVPGARDFPRRPSELSAATAAAKPVLAVSAHCSGCFKAGRLDAMRLCVCPKGNPPCSKEVLKQSMREANASWKEVMDARRHKKALKYSVATSYRNPALLAFCATAGPRIGEASHPGP